MWKGRQQKAQYTVLVENDGTDVERKLCEIFVYLVILSIYSRSIALSVFV